MRRKGFARLASAENTGEPHRSPIMNAAWSQPYW